MILEAAIINLTRNLDIFSQKDGQGVSSHTKLKEEGLTCLSSLIENAPKQEYKKLFESQDYEILLGYLVNVLCRIANDDSSKLLRVKALEVLSSLINRLEAFHDLIDCETRCSVNLIRLALPGVSSTLIKLIMKDTKLPKNLLVIALKVLSKSITISLLDCGHKALTLSGETLKETCDNLAIRLTYMIDYVICQSSNLHQEVKYEVLYLCEAIVCKTRNELISRLLKPMIKYIAFLTSINPQTKSISCEIQLKVVLITDSLKDKIQNCDNQCDGLETLVMTCLVNLLDNFENHYAQMLPAERESELSMFCGFIKLLPQETLTTFLEISERRQQLVKVFTQLAEFSNQQPFLFLTNAHIDHEALETCDEKIYTVEKRFAHLTDAEHVILTSCCLFIGESLDWLLINDILKTDLCLFNSPSHLYVAHLIIKGLLNRSNLNNSFCKFTRFMVYHYVENIQKEELTNDESMRIVITIETLITLADLHIKSSNQDHERVILLRYLLCPLLNSASSSNRAVSEAALSALAQISILYGCGSTKSLIEQNVDYVVDGVSQMLDNFVNDSQITNVLAITFKLSSIESFYYFKDIYEKIFKLLRVCHLTKKSESIALLFYRTLSILSDWKQAQTNDAPSKSIDPLKDETTIRSIINDLDIDRRLVKLQEDIESTARLKRRLEEMENAEISESEILDEIKEKKASLDDAHENQKAESVTVEKEKEKPPDIVLTEKILTHCISLMSSNFYETKVLALKAAACGFKLLRDDEDTLLPLVHKLWSPLVKRLTSDYKQNLEINLCAFECLVSMAECARDFIMKRALDSIIPRLCLFLESQAGQSRGQKDYGPYCMTMAYKCQWRILSHLGELAYHIQLSYSSLWRVVRTCLIYLDHNQVPSLRQAALGSLHYLIATDSDCVWYFAKKSGQLKELPFSLIYE